MAAIFEEDVKLGKADGSRHSAYQVLKGKLVGLYFSAHWCPPCRMFTKALKEFYEEVSNEEFEVVFMSGDRTEKDLVEYMQELHGDWFFMPLDCPQNDELNMKFEVAGIPMLIVLKKTGEVITMNGRADVLMKTPRETVEKWLAS